MAIIDVDIDAIEVIPTQYDAAPLVAGQVDRLLCWATDLPVAMTIQGVAAITMLMADHGNSVHSRTYIATDDSLASPRGDLVALMRGEAMGWTDYRADTAAAAAAALTVEMFPDADLDLATQVMQARQADPQVPPMFQDLADAEGCGWATDETVAANIETLSLFDFDVTTDLRDRSILEEIHG